MKIEKDSYIVVKQGTKNVLCFAHNPERNSAYIESTLNTDEPTVIEYTDDTVIAQLGKKPEVGKVFGVHVEPQRSEKLHNLGNVVYFRRMKAIEKKALRSAMDKTFDIFEERNFDLVLPVYRIEVRNKKGRKPGSYKYKVKNGDTFDVMELHPETFEDLKYNIYILCLQLSHALWYRKVSEEIKVRWVALYNHYIVVNQTKKERLENLLHALVSSGATLRDFLKELEPEELTLMREVLTYLKRHHKLSTFDVNLILTHNSQLLGEIWPDNAAFSESEHPLGVQAAANVESFFAEAMALSLTNKTLPKRIEKLVQRTDKFIRTAS